MVPPIALVITAGGIDRLFGDPLWCLHPVQVMGKAISVLRQRVEALAGDRPWALRLGGVLITLVLVTSSVLAGWSLEQLSLHKAFVVRCW